MADVRDAVIVVPEELTSTILREGYRCSRRGRVPCSRSRSSALRAFQQWHPGRRHAFLRVVQLPPGITADVHEDGLKINTAHLPAACVTVDSPGSGRASGTLLQPGRAGAAPQVHPGISASTAFDPAPRHPGGHRPAKIALRDIYYTQDSVADHFKDRRTLAITRDELESGQKTVHDIPTITVVEHHGRWLTVDNRRLCVFKRVFHSSFEVPVLHGVKDFRFYAKLKQPHGGQSVHVRGRGF
mmetsp:Transcript_71986/g.194710  ORF Transcript_71986/g.194710 Transcript_71986/m.194710 type:complete len:242 (+) Transcript_71986:91-816(+)